MSCNAGASPRLRRQPPWLCISIPIPNLKSQITPMLSRREMLQRSGLGFGSLALAWLLGKEGRLAGAESAAPVPPPHFPPRAKSVIFLFMGGGPSQVDTFDPKPE